MAKTIHDDVLDQALNYLKNNTTRISLCSAQPTTYTEAITTYMLAIKTVSATDFTGPSDGDTSGRKIRANAQTGVVSTNSGTATYAAWTDSALSKLLMVTTCTSQVITAPNPIDIPVHDYEIGDPA